MREHLIFLLAAPMASFGSYAGHKRRGSELVPMRSAVLGLVGAALGIDRADSGRHMALRAYSVAVQPFQDSIPLRDYHTAQTAPTAKAKAPPTRKIALERAGRDAHTIITMRDYRCDVLVGVALWGDGRWTLDNLARDLQRPSFPLYLGRKSCPLASPLNPVIVTTPGPVEALARIEIPEWLHSGKRLKGDVIQHTVFSDPVEGVDQPTSTEQVPGEPLDRQAWTFGECTLWHLSGVLGERESMGVDA